MLSFLRRQIRGLSRWALGPGFPDSGPIIAYGGGVGQVRREPCLRVAFASQALVDYLL
jgi:hypothetical protein